MTVAMYDGVWGALALKQLTSVDYSPDIKTATNRFSGGIDPSEIYVLSGEPVISLESMDLYTLLGAVSLSAGLAITSPGTITIPWQSRDPGGAFLGSTNHYNLAGTLGLLIITEISGSQDSEAGVTAKLEAYLASSDGLTAPVAINASVAVSSQSYTGSYSFGPASIAASNYTGAVPGLTSWTYKTGVTCQKKRYGGGIYPTMTGINITTRDPSIDLTFEDASALSNFAHYSALTSATVYGRQNVDGGARTADGSSAHLALTLTGGIQVLKTVSGNGQDNAALTRTITGKTQGVSRTSAIS